MNTKLNRRKTIIRHRCESWVQIKQTSIIIHVLKITLEIHPPKKIAPSYLMTWIRHWVMSSDASARLMRSLTALCRINDRRICDKQGRVEEVEAVDFDTADARVLCIHMVASRPELSTGHFNWTRADPTRRNVDPTRPDPTRPDPTPTRPDPTRPDPTRDC